MNALNRPGQDTPPWNPGNPLVNVGPAAALLDSGLLDCPDGVQRLMLIIKHPYGEVAVGLDWNDAEAWIANLADTHSRQSRLARGNGGPMPGQGTLPFPGGPR
jgi:hypothetical protein